MFKRDQCAQKEIEYRERTREKCSESKKIKKKKREHLYKERPTQFDRCLMPLDKKSTTTSEAVDAAF